MADPAGYEVSYSFGNFQANNPTSPLPAAQVDNELANIATAVAELVASIKNVRRSDGALQNGIVTYDSLELGLQLTFDPTNGALVAAAVSTAQAAAASATTQAGIATTQAGVATTQAAAAAASAGAIDLSLYLAKANNLAGLGNVDTALANILAMKRDGSTATGRLAKTTTGQNAFTNWNEAVESGWYNGFSLANQPIYGGGVNDWLVQVIAMSNLYITQIAYPFAAGTSTSSIVPFRRHGYNNAGSLAWTAWESQATVPVGTTIWVNGTNAPAGFLKENGALLSRATYPALWYYANASGNIVSEAVWSSTSSGAFSTGDLSTTFRLPDSRGEFIRHWDDGRGRDAGRVIGTVQADALKSHTHNTTAMQEDGLVSDVTAGSVRGGTNGSRTSGDASTGASSETRPRNVTKLACIKY
ncbi:MAG: hypothetical protein PS018_11500 [bacterium]|nr:hypothetical protein [bacterium]